MAAGLLFGLLFLFMIMGIPIVFSIELSNAAFLSITGIKPIILVAQRMIVGMDSFPLLAAPLFILTGYLMESSGLSRRLVDWVDSICGRLPGSMGVVTIVSCTIFAALTGSGPATVAAIGSIMMPALLNSGYKPGTSAGIIAAGGALGPIIPPSIGMIVYGSTMNLDIPKMFVAAIIPGLLMSASLIVMNLILVKKWKITPPSHTYTFGEILKRTWKALGALMLPVIILGGIYGGIFTPTEAAVVSVVYSIALGFIYRELKPKMLVDIFSRTVETSAIVILIIGMSNLFGWILAVTRIPVIISEAVISVVSSPTIYLMILTILLLIVGCLMETLSSIVILAPILIPIGIELGLDPLRLGMIFCINLIIGIITPPFGVNLFTAVSTTGLKYEEVVKGILPFMIVLVIDVIIITFVPWLIMWLPSMMH
jgi:C4-dicarboxylate transporter DctM subunit